MSALVILLLVALWAVIFVPGALRARRERHPVASVEGFSRTMMTLAGRQYGGLTRRQPVPGRWILVPGEAAGVTRARPRARAVRRRRAVLAVLAAVVLVALALAALAGGWAWALPAVSVVALVAYLGQLAVLAPGRASSSRPVVVATNGRREPVVGLPAAGETVEAVPSDGGVRGDAALLAVRTVPPAGCS